MKHRIHIVLVVGCALAVAAGLPAQSTPAPQQQPAQKPPAQKPAEQKPADQSNPFPEDTTSVPVVPANGEPAAETPAPAPDEAPTSTSLLKNDTDPARSPDDPTPDSSADSGFSSSLAGSSDVNIPDEERPTKHRKLDVPDKVHQETAKEDEDVGAYELGRKNWKAALSRFQSALVTDPENPEVYWGIAEAQRQLGDYAGAKVNYEKVTEYDPDSKHAKEAKKWLKEPQLANAPAAPARPQ